MSYRVIIIGSKGPELLGSFDDKGQCRRAWSTAKKGAAIATEDGRVLEHKGGTPRSVEGAIERFALQLARGGAKPAPAPVVAPEAPKARTLKRDENRCEACDELLPDHLTTCPTRPVAEPVAEPSKLTISVESATVSVEVEEEPQCVAKGCEEHRAHIRIDTLPVFQPFCRDHRKLIKDRVRDRGVTAEEVADALREGRDVQKVSQGARAVTSRTAPTAATVVARAPVVDREFDVNEPVEAPPALDVTHAIDPSTGAVTTGASDFEELPAAPVATVALTPSGVGVVVAVDPPAPPAVTVDALLEAAEKVFALFGEWSVAVTQSGAAIYYCGHKKVVVERVRGVDPLRQLAAALATYAVELVSVRARLVDETERELVTMRAKHVEALSLEAWLRSAGA